jgi:oligosaccharide repeat unit polymerase
MYEIALTVSVLCFAAITFAFVRSRAFSVFHPLTVYLAFHGLVFVVRPIIAYVSNYDLVYRAYQFTPSLSDKVAALLVSTFGMLVFAWACWRAGNVPMAFKHDLAARIERDRLKPAFFLIAALCVPIGVYSLASVWETAITTGNAFSNMIRVASTGRAYNEGTSGYVVEAQLMLVSCAAIVAWLFRFRIYALLPLLVFAVYRAGTGGRGPFIAALATTVLFYLYDRRRRLPSALTFALLPALLLVFTAVGDDRGAAIRRAIDNDMSSEVFGKNRTGERPLEGMDFANLEYLEYVIYAVPQRSGTYGYFNDLLQVFTEPIPRALWPDKPLGAPFQRINFFDYGNPAGMTISLPGEGWYSLGWAGVAIWCGLCGWALGAIYRRFATGPQGALAVAAYMVFLPTLIVAFRDGQLVTVFRQCLFFLLPIGLWWGVAQLGGLPKVGPMRAALRRNLLRDGDPERKPRPRQSSLPPAVLRRRIALAEKPARET